MWINTIKGFSKRWVALMTVLLLGIMPMRAQITDDLLLAVDSILELLVNDTVTMVSQTQKQAQRLQNDTTHHRILLFGDSMLDGVGRRFYEYAQESGHYLFTYLLMGTNDGARQADGPGETHLRHHQLRDERPGLPRPEGA